MNPVPHSGVARETVSSGKILDMFQGVSQKHFLVELDREDEIKTESRMVPKFLT